VKVTQPYKVGAAFLFFRFANMDNFKSHSNFLEFLSSFKYTLIVIS
jgi:hypothetical protein